MFSSIVFVIRGDINQIIISYYDLFVLNCTKLSLNNNLVIIYVYYIRIKYKDP